MRFTHRQRMLLQIMGVVLWVTGVVVTLVAVDVAAALRIAVASGGPIFAGGLWWRQRRELPPLQADRLTIPDAAVEAAVAFWVEQVRADRPLGATREDWPPQFAALLVSPQPEPTPEQLSRFSTVLSEQIHWQVDNHDRHFRRFKEEIRVRRLYAHDQPGVEVATGKYDPDFALAQALEAVGISPLRLPTRTATHVTPFYTAVVTSGPAGSEHRALWLNPEIPPPGCTLFTDDSKRCLLTMFHEGRHDAALAESPSA